MKHLVLFCMLAAGWLLHAQTYFQNELSIVNDDQLHEQVSDIDYNPDDDVYRSLHKTIKGMSFFTYDGTGNFLSVLGLYHAGGTALYPVRIIDLGTMTHILFYVKTVSGQNRYAVLQYDHSAPGITWVKRLSNPSNNIDCVPKDMDIDPAGGDIYIIGDQYNPATFDNDVFVTRIDAAGTQIWHYKYPVANRDDLAYSIFFHADTAIYLGAISNGAALDIKALVVQIDDQGTIINQTDITYGSVNNCQYNRMASACVKRQGNQIFVFIPSYAGSDGAGCLSWFKLDPAFNVLDFRMYDAGLVHYDPLFEFTDNGNNLSISGHQRIMASTPNLGYATYNFSKAGLFNMGGFSYPNTVHDFWGPDLIRTVYNPNTTDLVAVMDYYDYPDHFHLIKSNSFGETFTSCDKILDHNLCDCDYEMRDPGVQQLGILTDFIDINIIDTPLDHLEAKICESEDCPDCEYKKSSVGQLNDGDKIEFSVYPNPARDILNISGNLETIDDIRIIDACGRTILQVYSPASAALDISALDAGLYKIIIKHKDGMAHQSLVVH